jgi:hypothetical protein
MYAAGTAIFACVQECTGYERAKQENKKAPNSILNSNVPGTFFASPVMGE